MANGFRPHEGFASAFSRRSGPPLPPLQMLGSAILGSNPPGLHVFSYAQPMSPILIPVKGQTVGIPNQTTMTNNFQSSLISTIPATPTLGSAGRTIAISHNPKFGSAAGTEVTSPVPRMVIIKTEPTSTQSTPNIPFVGPSAHPVFKTPTAAVPSSFRIKSEDGSEEYLDLLKDACASQIGIPATNSMIDDVVPHVDVKIEPKHETSVMEDPCRIAILATNHSLTETIPLRIKTEDTAEPCTEDNERASQIGNPSTSRTINEDTIPPDDIKIEPLRKTLMIQSESVRAARCSKIAIPATSHALNKTIPLRIKTKYSSGEHLGTEKVASASQIEIPTTNSTINDTIPPVEIKLEPLRKTPMIKSEAVPRSMMQSTSLSSQQPASISNPVAVIDDSTNQKGLVDFFAQKGSNRSHVTLIRSPGTTEGIAGGNSHPKYLRNMPLEGQTKLMIYNVVRYFEDLKHTNGLNLNICQVVGAATGLAIRTVSRIWNEGKKLSIENPESIPKFTSAKPKIGYRFKKVKSDLNIDRIIRKCILERYANSETPQSLEDIACAEGMSAIVGWRYVRSRLSKLGLDMVKCRRRKICIERPEITVGRLNYLCDMEKYTKKNKNMVFLFEENVVMTSGQKSELWQLREDVEHIREDLRMHMPMLCVMHAASSRGGFVDGCLYFRESTYTHFKDETRSANKWLKDTVLPSIPKGSIVILGHRRYDIKEDVVVRPNADSSKLEILEWLRTHGDTSLDASYYHSVLLNRANQIPVEQECRIDSTIIESGHIPLHLPPFHRDLNPVEIIWRDISKKFNKANAPKSVEELKTCITQEIAGCNSQDLCKALELVQKQEQFYRKVDAAIDKELPKVVARMGGVVTERGFVESDSESSSDEDTEKVLITGDMDIDEDSDSPAPPKKSKKCRKL